MVAVRLVCAAATMSVAPSVVVVPAMCVVVSSGVSCWSSGSRRRRRGCRSGRRGRGGGSSRGSARRSSIPSGRSRSNLCIGLIYYLYIYILYDLVLIYYLIV